MLGGVGCGASPADLAGLVCQELRGFERHLHVIVEHHDDVAIGELPQLFAGPR